MNGLAINCFYYHWPTGRMFFHSDFGLYGATVGDENKTGNYITDPEPVKEADPMEFTLVATVRKKNAWE